MNSTAPPVALTRQGFLAGLAAAPFLAHPAQAQPASQAISTQNSEGAFAVIADGAPAAIHVDARDWPGVLRASRNLVTDLGAVAGRTGVFAQRTPRRGAPIIAGTLGKNALIDQLVEEGKLDVTGVTGVWEGFVQQVVERPAPGVARALVIAGADKRGTIFGMYDLAERCGVSPWSWWADVVALRQSNLYVSAGRRVDFPRVKYRGIFLNDEDPALKGWAEEKFGGLNHRFYERVFDLILRLKGNYLWPAMWGKAIYDDDAQSPVLADEMGVVLGASHHEPCMRAHVEWERYGGGTPWNYATNAERLRTFWREGITRMGDNESLVTVGMRGDGDEPMTQGTAIELLETIVRDQRAIIADVTHRPASETPQIWALYKEVQDYYDAGMRVPDDVTLLFADDNWGNIRRLPELGRTRPGGYGIYYHFDYVGGPRNYKWINTNQIERAWEQLHLARAYGVDRVWIVNVGDLKPMEFPISFHFDYAWNPEAWPLDRLRDYPVQWAARQFGLAHGFEIGELLTRYTQYNARRKPELLDADTFSLSMYNEWPRIVADWAALRDRAQRIGEALAPDQQSAYFQLVAHPILASANLNEMYFAVACNRRYGEDGRASAAAWGERARELYARDGEITRRYHALNDGRWNHFMDQTHIGYTTWQQPDVNVMPALTSIDPTTPIGLGLALEGGGRMSVRPPLRAELPELSPYGPQTRWFEIYRRGVGAAPDELVLEVESALPWVQIERQSDAFRDARFLVSVDWARAGLGRTTAPIIVREVGGATIQFNVNVFNPGPARTPGAFVEAAGVIAMEAAHGAAVETRGATWRDIPNLGRTLSGVTSYPVTGPAQTPGGDSPRIEFPIELFSPGDRQIRVDLAATQAFNGTGLRYGISIDDAPPQIINVHRGPDGQVAHSGEHDDNWEHWVANNIISSITFHRVARAGVHVVKVWLVDPGLVFERVIVSRQGLPQSYLGPPETGRAPPI